MSAAIESTPPQPVASVPTFVRLVRSEALKMLTVRSTWWALGVAVSANIVVAALIMVFLSDSGVRVDPVATILGASALTMLVAAVLGTIAITGEYSTGMIRSTLAAEPRRARVVVAKAAVMSVTIAVTTCVSYLGAAIVATAVGAGAIPWDDPAASLWPLAGGVAAMVSYALIGMGFGLIVRNSAGAIAVTLGVLFVLPVFVSLFHVGGSSWQWVVSLGSVLPVSAAVQLMGLGWGDRGGPALILLAWVVVLLSAGTFVLRTRDA